MEINTMNRTDPPLPTAGNVSPEIATQNRELVQAVRAVNGSEMLGLDEELDYQLDAATKHLVVRILNRNTKEVLTQVPPEYVLRMAEDLKSR